MEKLSMTYDYLTVQVTHSTKELVQDVYENLGWEVSSKGIGTINFKRNRKINNKKELKEIEDEIKTSIDNICQLEKAKTNKGTIISLCIGIIGTIVFGAGLSLALEFSLYIMGIILGIVGIVIALPAYPIYANICKKETNKALILIDEEFDKIMAINLRAPFMLIQQALPALKKSSAAAIVNIASVVAHAGYPQQSIYTASKHALLGMTKSIASEYYKHNIRVHAISPGGVYTDMVKISRPDLSPEGMILPEDVAETVHFLLTNRTNAVIDEIIMHRAGKEPFLV